MIEGIEAVARKRVAMRIEQLRETAEADMPSGVRAEPAEDGLVLSGPGLAHALAFDGRMRGWAARMGSGR